MDVYDFTPIQYPADDQSAEWRTTHFDFHSIDDNVLKLDILGHDDPTVLRMLQDLSGIDPRTIPTDDPEVMRIFSGPEPLGVTEEQIMCKTGTLGIPEFGTRFVRQMLEETHPSTFSELITNLRSFPWYRCMARECPRINSKWDLYVKRSYWLS